VRVLRLSRSIQELSNMATQSSASSSRRSKMGGTPVGQFKIEDEIGKGSFATVYRGVHRVSVSWFALGVDDSTWSRSHRNVKASHHFTAFV
jgi:hypothetical protein